MTMDMLEDKGGERDHALERLIMLLIMPVPMPPPGLVASGAEVRVLAPIPMLVLLARIFRSRLKQSIKAEWRP